jgi:hypothetical protein
MSENEVLKTNGYSVGLPENKMNTGCQKKNDSSLEQQIFYG